MELKSMMTSILVLIGIVGLGALFVRFYGSFHEILKVIMEKLRSL